jgi:hypothetical protein
MIERGFAAVNASLADMRRMPRAFTAAAIPVETRLAHRRHRKAPPAAVSGQAMIEDPFQGVRP